MLFRQQIGQLITKFWIRTILSICLRLVSACRALGSRTPVRNDQLKISSIFFQAATTTDEDIFPALKKACQMQVFTQEGSAICNSKPVVLARYFEFHKRTKKIVLEL